MSRTLDALRERILTAMTVLDNELQEKVRTLRLEQESYDDEWDEWDRTSEEERGEEPEDPGHSGEIEHLEEQMSQLEDAQQSVEELTWEAGA